MDKLYRSIRSTYAVVPTVDPAGTGAFSLSLASTTHCASSTGSSAPPRTSTWSYVGADQAGNLLEVGVIDSSDGPITHPCRARPTEIPEVSPMPRTAQAIIDHADALAARFEQHQPGVHVRDASALGTVRGAFLGRAEAERNLAAAVVQARHAGHSWASIGAMVGTSGEAARQRYGQSVSAS